MGSGIEVGDSKMAMGGTGARHSVEDVVKSYVWLGHRGYTELNGYHPDYKAGKETFEWNLKHETFPKVWYAKNPDEAVRFVERYSGSRTVCYSLNPRPNIFKNQNGFARSAVESEIVLSQNLLFDFDFESKTVSESQLDAFAGFLSGADTYFLDQKLQVPARAYTGRGYHLLFAYPPIDVRKNPDVGPKLREFRNTFSSAFHEELSRLEAKLDNTQDLRRMVRIYGTAKPQVGIVSRFYGNERAEDERLRDYLLALELPEDRVPAAIAATLNSSREIPQWFHSVLEQDRETRELWSGIGKPQNTDTSSSGFDYSLVRRLLKLGHRNIDDLASVLARRPDGSVQRHGKGDAYIRRTIANALIRGTDGERA